MYTLSGEQIASFQRDKYLVVDDILTPDQVRRLVEEVDACAKWAGHSDKEKKYFLHRECSLLMDGDDDQSGRCGGQTKALVMNRIENVTSATPDGMIAALALPISSGDMKKALIASTVAQLMDEDMVLLKDKINFKASGGGGR